MVGTENILIDSGFQVITDKIWKKNIHNTQFNQIQTDSMNCMVSMGN